MRHVPELDALRGLAIIGVVLHHSPGLEQFSRLGPILGLSFAAVDLLLVVSGFLFTTVLLEHDTRDLRAYSCFLMRRALRIAPVYYVTLLIAVIVVVWQGSPPPWSALAHALVFMQNVPLYWAETAPVIEPFSPSWLVAAMVQFALIWPLLIGWLGRRAIVPLSVLLLVAGLASRADGYSFQLLLTRSDGLALGAILAVLAQSGALDRHRIRYALAFVVLGVLSVVVLFWLTPLALAIGARWPGLSASSLVIAAMLTCSSLAVASLTGLILCYEGHPVLRFLRARSLRALGLISLGIYLYHPIYFYILSTGVPIGRQTLSQTALVYAATLITANVSWKVLEEPFLEIKSGFAYRRTDAADETS
ncbi:MAG: acyltransferase [Isosphaeraceae bacterium]